MPYYFFFSYARANNDPYLSQFFDDLSDKIRDKVGLGKDVTVGFFDQRDIQLGAEWDEELVQALQTCPVIVSLYSPAYFNSPYCGKEWQFFQRRRQLYVTTARAAGAQNVELPSVIKPVIWIPLRQGKTPPAAVAGAQYTMGDPRANHNRVGLRDMRKRYASFEEAYDGFINQLADQILDALETFTLPSDRTLLDWTSMVPPLEHALPQLDASTLDTIESPFHSTAPVQPGELAELPIAPSRRRGGPKSVRFIIVAAKPDEFPRGERTPEVYLQYGGADWKPFLPVAPGRVIALAQTVAGQLDISSDELPFIDNLSQLAQLRQVLRDAETSNSLVIMFVDPWTAKLPSYALRLKAFDEYNYLNCSIFIPWNKDEETAEVRNALKQWVRKEVFPRWSRWLKLNEPLYFNDSVDSIEDLRDQLQTTLTQLQSLIGKEAIEHATKDDIPRRIETDIAKPSLSHKSAPEGGAV